MIMTQATANKITYTYQHCSAEDFTHQVSFSEEEFNKQIAQIFNTNLPIDRVELEFVLQDKKTGHFLVIIRVYSPKFNFHHQEETYSNYAAAVRKAIKAAVEFVRSKKEKLAHLDTDTN